jgi:hypothetical protein
MEIIGKGIDENRLTHAFNSVSAISGHFYKFANLVPSNFYKVTILRNPLDRTVSAYNHMIADISDPWHDSIAGFSFEQALEDQRFATELWNGQTRALVGAAGKDFEILNDAERIESAMEVLGQMDLVGFQEHLAPFYDALRSEHGLQVDYKARVNEDITSQGISSHELMHLAAKISMRNRLDIFVYFLALSSGFR